MPSKRGRARAPRVVWIAEVVVSPRTAEKIRDKHGLDPDEVATLVWSPPPRIGRWVVKDDGKRRLHIKVRTEAGEVVLVVLFPIGDDVWAMASAYVLERRRRA